MGPSLIAIDLFLMCTFNIYLLSSNCQNQTSVNNSNSPRFSQKLTHLENISVCTYEKGPGVIQLDLKLNLIFDSRSSNLTSIQQFYDSALTRLRLQSFSICLDNKSWVRTMLRQNLFKIKYLLELCALENISADVFTHYI